MKIIKNALSGHCKTQNKIKMEKSTFTNQEECVTKPHESLLTILNYRHEMFASKLDDICVRIDLITTDLVGKYKDYNLEPEIYEKEPLGQIVNYEALLSRTEKALGNIYEATSRLENCIKFY